MPISILDEKVVILGDIHLGARGDSLAFHRRYEKFFDFLFSYMKANGLSTIIQVGDCFDRRKFISFQTLNVARKYLFDRLAQHDIKMVILVGNHDTHLKSSLDGNAPSLLLQAYASHITVIDQPTDINIGDTRALLVPWICRDNETLCLDKIANSTAPLCMGHFELVGFEMYKGSPAKHGMSKDIFWKFHQVYSGHFHHVSSRDNITYVGSPFQITWADFEDDRGFFVLDTKKLTTEFVKNPFENFYRLTYDDTKLELDDLNKIDYERYRDTFVKVVVTRRENQYLFDKFVENLEKVDANVQTVHEQKFKNVTIDKTIDSEVDDIKMTFKKAAQPFKDSVDVERLHQFLLQLYDTASRLDA